MCVHDSDGSYKNDLPCARIMYLIMRRFNYTNAVATIIEALILPRE